MSTHEKDITISYYVEEIENKEENNFNIEDLMIEIENAGLSDNDLMLPQMINYNEN